MNHLTRDYDGATALLVVDVQNDFADPSGSLYVTGGEEIIHGINAQIAAARGSGATVVLTQDWHPPTTPHFVDEGGMWPVHCVRDSWGAELHPDLVREADLIMRKGTGGEDGYSAFTVVDPETDKRHPTGVSGYLAERGVTSVVVVGLALDVCIAATAVDATRSGLDATVIVELTRAVERQEGDSKRKLAEMRAAGVKIVGTATET